VIDLCTAFHIAKQVVQELEESRQILRRIRKRDLYRLVDKEFRPWESRDIWRKYFTPERIVEAAKRLDPSEYRDPGVKKRIAELTVEHVIVDISALHHGMGDQFPLDNCKFYGKYNPNGMHLSFTFKMVRMTVACSGVPSTP
jgi:deoxynucleoside triphosphate triphosphohydrolase SAMHD1